MKHPILDPEFLYALALFCASIILMIILGYAWYVLMKSILKDVRSFILGLFQTRKVAYNVKSDAKPPCPEGCGRLALGARFCPKCGTPKASIPEERMLIDQMGLLP